MEKKIIKISELKPHPQNPNTHSEMQIKELQDSLDQFDQVKNIVVWQSHIIAGHGLVEAAKKEGLENLEAVDVSEWDAQKAIKFMVADNQLASLGVIDDEILQGILQEVDNPIEIPGIDQDFLDKLFNEDSIEILDSIGGLDNAQYGLVGSSTKVPFSVLGVGGLVDREVMEKVRDKLLEMGAIEDKDNGEVIKELLLTVIR